MVVVPGSVVELNLKSRIVRIGIAAGVKEIQDCYRQNDQSPVHISFRIYEGILPARLEQQSATIQSSSALRVGATVLSFF